MVFTTLRLPTSITRCVVVSCRSVQREGVAPYQYRINAFFRSIKKCDFQRRHAQTAAPCARATGWKWGSAHQQQNELLHAQRGPRTPRPQRQTGRSRSECRGGIAHKNEKGKKTGAEESLPNTGTQTPNCDTRIKRPRSNPRVDANLTNDQVCIVIAGNLWIFQ